MLKIATLGRHNFSMITDRGKFTTYLTILILQFYLCYAVTVICTNRFKLCSFCINKC